MTVGADIPDGQIERLVDVFYTRIHADERLGPIFATEISGEWETHLDKMKQFWRSVLLKTREYNGRPVPAHAKLQGIEISDFQNWLGIFRQTAREVFAPDIAELAIQNAERIATSLWFSMNNDPFAPAPNWSDGRSIEVS